MEAERLLDWGDEVCWFRLSRFIFVLRSPSVGMAEDFVKEPQSWGQAPSQTAFILSLLMHSLAAGAGSCQRNPNGSICSVILKLLPLQTNLDTHVMFSSS